MLRKQNLHQHQCLCRAKKPHRTSQVERERLLIAHMPQVNFIAQKIYARVCYMVELADLGRLRHDWIAQRDRSVQSIARRDSQDIR